jgi:hypothetical protein
VPSRQLVFNIGLEYFVHHPENGASLRDVDQQVSVPDLPGMRRRFERGIEELARVHAQADPEDNA